MNYLILINWTLISYFTSGELLPMVGSILGLAIILYTKRFESIAINKKKNLFSLMAMMISVLIFLITKNPIVSTWIAYVSLIKNARIKEALYLRGLLY